MGKHCVVFRLCVAVIGHYGQALCGIQICLGVAVIGHNGQALCGIKTYLGVAVTGHCGLTLYGYPGKQPSHFASSPAK